MRRISDEELILYYYGESAAAEEIRRQLADSTDLRDRFAALERFLDALEEPSVPAPPAAYGSRIWHRIAPQLASQRPWHIWRWWRPRRQWAWTAAVLVLLVVAFLAGRILPRQEGATVAGLPADGRERILLVTVAGHLERSEMLLLELVNSRGDGDLDLSIERQMAGELGQESRLYRQAAQRAGKGDVAALLEQLETVLLEIANGPDQVPAGDLGELRLRLDEGDVLFRVRVLGSHLRQQVRSEDSGNGDGPRAHEI